MFTRKTVNTLMANVDSQGSPQSPFLHRRPIPSSPAKRLFALVKSGFSPTKTPSKVAWKENLIETSLTIATGATKLKSILLPSSYAAAVIGNDGKSLTRPPLTTKPSGISQGYDLEIDSFRHKYKNTIPSFAILAKLPYSPTDYSAARSARMYQKEFYEEDSDDNFSDIDADDSSFDIENTEDSFTDYGFLVGRAYKTKWDNDLAIERKRFHKKGRRGGRKKGTGVHLDGVEMTAVEQEFTKTFDRMKFFKGSSKNEDDDFEKGRL